MERSKKVLLLLVVGIIATLLGLLLVQGYGGAFSLEALKQSRDGLVELNRARPVLVASLFFMTYVTVAALSLPGMTPLLTLAAGAMFGLPAGFVLVSFASTLGALLAFSLARFLARDWVDRRLGDRLRGVREGLAREGAFYLFALRLTPLVPYSLVNLSLGLSRMKASTFYLVSQVGMIPGTVAYVNAGTQLGTIRSVRDVLEPRVWLSLAMLGLFPLWVKRVVEAWRARRRT